MEGGMSDKEGTPDEEGTPSLTSQVWAHAAAACPQPLLTPPAFQSVLEMHSGGNQAPVGPANQLSLKNM